MNYQPLSTFNYGWDILGSIALGKSEGTDGG